MISADYCYCGYVKNILPVLILKLESMLYNSFSQDVDENGNLELVKIKLSPRLQVLYDYFITKNECEENINKFSSALSLYTDSNKIQQKIRNIQVDISKYTERKSHYEQFIKSLFSVDMLKKKKINDLI